MSHHNDICSRFLNGCAMLSVDVVFSAQLSNDNNGFMLGSELKASQSQSRGARRRATGSRLISVASGVHVLR
jgi:hypothetical protein